MPKQNAVQTSVSPSITQNNFDAIDCRNVSRTIHRTVRIAVGAFMPPPPSDKAA